MPNKFTNNWAFSGVLCSKTNRTQCENCSLLYTSEFQEIVISVKDKVDRRQDTSI